MNSTFTNHLRLLAIVVLSLVCTTRSEAIKLSTNDLTHSVGNSNTSGGILSDARLRNTTLGVWRAFMPDSRFAGIAIGGTVTNVKCYGENTGHIILSVSGGTSPYTYLWSNGETLQNPFSLAANTYSVTVTDAAGLSASKSFVISQPAQIIAYINCTPVCFGECNGDESITVSGGTPNYTYSWSGPNGFSAGNVATISGLCGGTFWVTVTDANGCVKIVGGTVCNSPKIIIKGTAANVSCFGACNGSILASITEGTDTGLCKATTHPFSFAWAGPNGFTGGNDSSIHNLCSGTYYVTVTNRRGCTALDTFHITQPDSLNITSTDTNVTCFGSCNGTATVSISGGTPAYTISWAGSTGIGLARTGLCPGTYCFTVTDANTCSKSGCVTVTQPDSINLTLTRNATCLTLFDSTASLTAVATGGTGSFTYTWSGAGGFTASGGTILIKDAGVFYHVTVTDANGCTKTDSISTPSCACPAGSLTIVGPDSVCFASLPVTLVAHSTLSALSYSWIGPNGFTSAGATDSVINVSAGGIYTVSVVFGPTPNCMTSTSDTLVIKSQPIVSVDSTNILCTGTCSGTITLAVTNVTGYTTSWTGPVGFTSTNSSSLTGLCAGTYCYTVDANGCTSSGCVNINEPDTALAIVPSFNNATCYGACNGSASIAASGGVRPYTIIWDNTALSGFSVSGLCIGTYCFTVTDANRCISSGCLSISQPDSLHVTSTSANATCFGSCNGNATVTVSGGTPGYTVSWAGSADITLTRTGLCAGTYCFTIMDASSCSKSGCVTITQPDSLHVASTTTTITCFGSCNGTATVTVSGGTPGYTISWAGSTDTTLVRTALCAGTYCFTVTDASSCSKSGCVTITQPTEIIAFINCTPVCFGQCNGTAILTASGGTPPYTYTWTGPNGFTAGNVDTLSGLCAGDYFVTVTDSLGCIKITESTVCSNPQIVISADTSITTCFGACTGFITLSVSHGSSPVMCTAGGICPITYLWTGPSGFTSTSAALTDLCTGTYTVTVTDCKGCTASRIFNITQPDSLHVTSTNTNVACYGSCNGTATVSVSGGTPSYTISWNNANVSGLSPTGLCAGTYCFTITDASSCSKSGCVTITQPDSLHVASTTTTITCFGSCNGSATVAVSGGTPGYTISWAGSTDTTLVRTALCAGTYCFTVTDASSCSKSGCVTITQPTEIIAFINCTPVCFGQCNGTAILTASGGTPPYTYTWTGPNGFTAGNVDTLSGLCAGDYFVTVTDSLGCIKITESTVCSNPQIVISADTSITTCFGACTGFITLSVSHGSSPVMCTAGGICPITYLWTGPSGFTSTSAALTDLCTGTYTVTVTDCKGCTASRIFNITQPDSLHVTSTNTNVACYGSCNGTATVSVSGGTPSYTISWNNVNVSGLAPTGLCAGVYCFTVTDANRCSKTGCVTITQPDSLTVTITPTNVTCYGSCNGNVAISISGGTPSYSVSWDNASLSGFTPIGLCAGTYCYTVLDANGCNKTGCITITQPDSLTITTTPTNVTCYGSCNGSVTVNVTGGTVGNSDHRYHIAWAQDGISGFAPTGLCAGTYCYTVTDANSCSKTGCVTITQPDSLLITSTNTTITCFGSCNGTATVSISGGTPGYTISWAGSNSTGLVRDGLCAGTYCYTVTDANSCNKSGCVTITQPDSLSILSQSDNTSCFGSCDGNALITVSGGTPGYTISWNNVNLTGFLVQNLCAGTYCFTVSDTNGCTKSGCVTITQPDTLHIVVSQTGLTCFNSCTGTITVTVSGGTTSGADGNPYSIVWNNINVTGFTPTGLCAGTYCYTVTDVNGCSKTGCVSIIQPDSLSVTASHTDLTCNELNGPCDGTITVSAAGGTAPYTITWSDNLFGATGGVQTNLCPDTYCYTVTDANGCSKTGCVTINQPPVLLIASNCCPDEITCHNACNGKIDITIFGGVPPFTYSWSGPNGYTSSDSDIMGLCPGIYTVTVTDKNGCTYDNTHAPLINPDSIVSNISGTVNTNCSGSCNGSASVAPTGGSAPFTFIWSTGGTNDTIQGLCAGEYHVTITDNLGCVIIDSIRIFAPSCSCPTVIATHTDVPCFGGTGSITIHISQPIPAGTTITLYGPGGVTTVTDTLITGLTAGNYCYVVKSSNPTCSDSACVTITQPDSLHVSTVSTNPAACSATCTGSITVSVSGGTPSYTISWDDANVIGFTPTALCMGTYCYTVTDANGCSKTGCVTLTMPAGTLQASIANTNITCFGSCNGTATITASGGTPSYTISWNNTSVSGFAPTGLCAGTYCFTVTDVNGCANSNCVTITQPDSLSVVSTNTNITCYGSCNGTATVTVSGGSPGYTISWAGSSSTGLVRDRLCAGTYCFTVTDVNGCAKSSCITISQPDSLHVSSTFNNSTPCSTACTGSIALSVSGGTPSYTISWDNVNVNGFTPIGLCTGTYCYTVTDANGCSKTGCVTLTMPAGTLQASIANTNVTCFGSCNGTATITASGGTPSYTISWNSGNVSGFAPTGLCAGTYCFTVTDVNGCASSNCVTITQPDSLHVSTVSTNSAPCSATCTGSVTVSVSGGTPSYTISWNNANVTGFTPAGLCTGTYCYTVTDANGCSKIGCVTLTTPSGSLTVTTTSTNLTCNEINGPCDGTITLGISGGKAPYIIAWSSNLFGDSDSVLTNLCPDTYCYTVTDANGCSQSGCVTITQPPMLLVGSNCCPDNITCHNACDGRINITVFGGVPPFTYSWMGTNGFTSSDSDLINLCAGMYTVTVTDKNGCTYDHTHAPLINPDSIIINISSTDNTKCNADSCNGTASVNPTGGAGKFVIAWSNGGTTTTITGLCAGMYVVTVTDYHGCVIDDSVMVSAPGCSGIFADAPFIEPHVTVYPNPFTTFTNIEFMSPVDDNVVLEIYSSTGVKVAELYRGTIKGGVKNIITYTNNNLAEGMYFYRLGTSSKTITGNVIIAH